MSRSQRLLDLIQILRNHRFPVTGAYLAGELGISLRTLYRDIVTLQGQGANIAGEPGMGYILQPGFMLPPLMFSEDEIEALALGAQWVTERGDKRFASAAHNALSKIAAVIPQELRHTLESSGLLVVPGETLPTDDKIMSNIRHALRAERKLDIIYMDLKQQETQRIIWPCALGYFEQVHVLVGWCESRQAFRHFRTDRIKTLLVSDQRYPRRRQQLLKEWRETENTPERCYPQK